MWPLKKAIKSKNSNRTTSDVGNVIELINQEPYEGILQKGMTTPMDLICPTAINTTSPNYLAIDGIYSATLMVCSYPFEVSAAWLSDIVSFGGGVDISIYIEPLQKSKKVTSFPRGYGLFYANANHAAVEIRASESEKELIVSSREDLTALKQKYHI